MPNAPPPFCWRACGRSATHGAGNPSAPAYCCDECCGALLKCARLPLPQPPISLAERVGHLTAAANDLRERLEKLTLEQAAKDQEIARLQGEMTQLRIDALAKDGAAIDAATAALALENTRLLGLVERWGVIQSQGNEEDGADAGRKYQRCRCCGCIAWEGKPLRHKAKCEVGAALATADNATIRQPPVQP